MNSYKELVKNLYLSVITPTDKKSEEYGLNVKMIIMFLIIQQEQYHIWDKHILQGGFIIIYLMEVVLQYG